MFVKLHAYGRHALQSVVLLAFNSDRDSERLSIKCGHSARAKKCTTTTTKRHQQEEIFCNGCRAPSVGNSPLLYVHRVVAPRWF